MKIGTEFCKRGLMFSGFGALIVAAVSSLEGAEAARVFTSVASGWLLAFVVAGCSVFYQVESWGLAKATFLHIVSLYVAYLACYLLNGWLAASWQTVGIFTAIFAVCYLVIWSVVYLCVRNTAKKLNKTLKK